MLAPINYSAMLEKLDATPLLQGLQQRHAMKATDALNKQRQQQFALEQQKFQSEEADKARAEAQRQQFFTRWKQVADAPTAEGYAGLRADFPDQLKTIDAGQSSFDERQRAIGRDVATGIYANVLGDDTAAAVGAIDAGIQKYGEVGRPVGSLTTLRTMLSSGKPNQVAAARRVATMMLAQEAGEQYGSVFSSLSREQREADLLPNKLRRAEADADYAETRAEYAPAQQRETLRGRQARTASTQSLTARRNAPRAASPATSASAPASGVRVRRGEQTASDGKGGTFVVRGGKWVRAK